jgi:hypothetical protein
MGEVPMFCSSTQPAPASGANVSLKATAGEEAPVPPLAAK